MAAIPRAEKLVEQALTWIVQADGGSPAHAEAASAALRAWRQASPAHEAAALEAQGRWNALGQIDAGLRARFTEPDDQSIVARKRQRRRLVLSIAGLLGTGALAGRGLHWYWQQPIFVADYATQTAQLQTIQLPDSTPGSRLSLSPRSAVGVRLYRQQRVVDFRAGEAYFDVTADAQRPFEVHARGVVIRVVGTAFTVRDRGGAVTVGVEHGLVRAMVARASSDPMASSPVEDGIDLRAGDVLSLHDGVADRVRRVDTATLSAWRDGWLVFDATPLGEALETINAYRSRPISAPDPRVSALKLTGRFRANSSAALVDALPLTLPLTAQTHPDGSVTLRAR